MVKSTLGRGRLTPADTDRTPYFLSPLVGREKRVKNEFCGRLSRRAYEPAPTERGRSAKKARESAGFSFSLAEFSLNRSRQSLSTALDEQE